MHINHKKLAAYGLALATLALAGCQGRLHLLLYNDSRERVIVVSDQKQYSIRDKDIIRFRSPTNKILTIIWGTEKFSFAFPFNPRPHTLNKYMNGGKLEVRIQITSARRLLVLPDGTQFPFSHTNDSSAVIQISGHKE
jgi:hypothetical protein